MDLKDLVEGCMVDFVADFMADIVELIAKPWVDKMNKKWKSRKRNR